MKNTIILPSLTIILLLLFSFSASAEIDCQECHGDLAQGKSVHAAVSMGCTSCHSAIDARDIPHKIKNRIARGLSSEQPQLCYSCHDAGLFEKKNIHGALGMGCTACHNPHASRTEKLIRLELPDLCYACHADLPFMRENVHPPVAAGQCTTCHLPHSSDNASLLENPVKNLCAQCHDDKASGRHILAGYGFGDRHPTNNKRDPGHPGKELSCASCHTPHSSSTKFLFTDAAGRSGSLCAVCHEKIIVRP